jgi:cellulose synthase/poly-beta-1,6-N-acetylglucosamine synthase-like glycosyltransferase
MVERGRLVKVGLPRRWVELLQVVEYVRSFVATRAGWSALQVLPLISGAFGVFKREALLAVGGYVKPHLGEDLDVTMHLHWHYRNANIPYRIVYVPEAVVWTELPTTVHALYKQRVRWHRGLFQVVVAYAKVTFNPRFKLLGLLVWPAFLAFEFLAPILEAAGWVMMVALAVSGVMQVAAMIWLALLVMAIGVVNTLLSLLMDVRFGVYLSPSSGRRLILAALIEQFGYRQLTVLWRLKAMFWNPWNGAHEWEVARVGVANLASSSSE